MKTTLIQPPFFRLIGMSNRRLGVGTSFDAALLRDAGHDVEIVNLDSDARSTHLSWRDHFTASRRLDRLMSNPAWAEVENETRDFIHDFDPQAVVTECGNWPTPAKDLSDVNGDLAMGRLLKKIAPGVRTVAVGFAPSSHPGLYKKAFDSVIVGVPGWTLAQAVTGDADPVAAGHGFQDYVGLMPHLTVKGTANPDASCVMLSFGCAYGKCAFCPSALYFQGATAHREPKLFADDVSRRQEGTLNVLDNDFGRDLDMLEHCAYWLRRSAKRLVVDIRLEAARQPRRLDLLRQLHVHTVKVGVESLSDLVLGRMNKGQTFLGVRDSLVRLRDAGFHILAYLLLGSPGDTPASMRETLDKASAIPWVQWLPNIFCEPSETDCWNHHFSYENAGRRGVPGDVLDAALDLADRPAMSLVPTLKAA